MSEYVSLSSSLAFSTFIFLMPCMSLDIFSSAIRSVFCDRNASLVDDKHCMLMLRVGAENVFDSIFSVRRSCECGLCVIYKFRQFGCICDSFPTARNLPEHCSSLELISLIAVVAVCVLLCLVEAAEEEYFLPCLYFGQVVQEAEAAEAEEVLSRPFVVLLVLFAYSLRCRWIYRILELKAIR